MIQNYSAIRERISRFRWQPTKDEYPAKVKALSDALGRALNRAAPTRTATTRVVHLTWSGGVDSTLLLFRLLAGGQYVHAHTIADAPGHPDAEYTRWTDAEYTRWTAHGVSTLTHDFHLIRPEPGDVVQVNTIKPSLDGRVDMYFYLMGAVAPMTRTIICGDCVDELLGGYYSHLDSGEPEFQSRLHRLVPEHLEHLDAFSTHFGVEVILPYADPDFMAAAARFTFKEMVGDGQRKKPVYHLAQAAGVPSAILQRRKYGLVQAVGATCP